MGPKKEFQVDELSPETAEYVHGLAEENEKLVFEVKKLREQLDRDESFFHAAVSVLSEHTGWNMFKNTERTLDASMHSIRGLEVRERVDHKPSILIMIGMLLERDKNNSRR